MEFDRNKFDLVSALGNVDHSSTEIHILVSDFPKTKQQSSLKSFPRQLARAKFDWDPLPFLPRPNQVNEILAGKEKSISA